MRWMFYGLSSSVNNRHKYIYKDQSFRGYSKKICENCSRDIVTMLYDDGEHHQLILDGGKIYPDLLQFCGAGEKLLVLSEMALSVLVREKVSGILKYEPVTVLDEKIIELDKAAPLYYSVKLSGSIDLDYSAMFLKKKKHCNRCGQYELNRQRLHPFIVDKNTWDGSDVCFLKTFPAFVICTNRFVHIIKSNRLTGFSFEELKEKKGGS